MEQEKKKVYMVGEGEVYLWLEQESSIHIKAVSKFGDPVELTGDEALELAKILQNLGEQILFE